MKRAIRRLTRISTGQMGVVFVDAETGEILPHPLPEGYEALDQNGSALSNEEVVETNQAVAETQALSSNYVGGGVGNTTTGGNGKNPFKGATLKTPFKGLRNIFSKDDQGQEYAGEKHYPTTPKTRAEVGVPYKDKGDSKEPMPEGWEGPDQVRSWLNTDEGKETSRMSSLDEPYDEKAYYETEGLSTDYVNERQETNAKDRKGALSSTLVSQLAYAGQQTGITFVSTSGGQTPKGGLAMLTSKGREVGRTDSDTVNHDNGNASDGYFKDSKTGKILSRDNQKDYAKIMDFISFATEAGVNSVGFSKGYMDKQGVTTAHFGGGAIRTWGRDNSSKTADKNMQAAQAKGLQSRKTFDTSKLDLSQNEVRNIDPFTTDQNSFIPEETAARGIIDGVTKVDPANLSNESVEVMIRNSAIARGIDPDVAVNVAKAEGLGGSVDYTTSWRSTIGNNGVQEPSYGPFQLLVGKDEEGYGPGLGDEFISKTGLDPRDPSTVQAQVNFALDHAAKNGWGSWYGADNVVMPQGDGLTTSKAIGWQNTTPTQTWDYTSEEASIPVPQQTSNAGAYDYSQYQSQNANLYTPPTYDGGFGGSSTGNSRYGFRGFSNADELYGSDNGGSPSESGGGYTPTVPTSAYDSNPSLASAYQDYSSSRTQSNNSATTGSTSPATTSYDSNPGLASAYQNYNTSTVQDSETTTGQGGSSSGSTGSGSSVGSGGTTTGGSPSSSGGGGNSSSNSSSSGSTTYGGGGRDSGTTSSPGGLGSSWGSWF